MNVKEFVSDTLKQVIDGVIEAQAYGKERGAHVNPLHLPVRDHVGKQHSLVYRQDIAHPIEFDIAVTINQGTETKGGVGVVIAGWTLGATGKTDKGSEHVSRIKFTIPVVLPTTKD